MMQPPRHRLERTDWFPADAPPTPQRPPPRPPPASVPPSEALIRLPACRLFDAGHAWPRADYLPRANLRIVPWSALGIAEPSTRCSRALPGAQRLERGAAEGHLQGGGCAGNFRRRAYTLMWGPTQVAGWSRRGHHSVCSGIWVCRRRPLTPLDPRCVVDPGRWAKPPIKALARFPWRVGTKERPPQHFPGSEDPVLEPLRLAASGHWGFAPRPVLRPATSGTWAADRVCGQAIWPALLVGASVPDLLQLSGLARNNQRLAPLLDLQLRLYSRNG